MLLRAVNVYLSCMGRHKGVDTHRIAPAQLETHVSSWGEEVSLLCLSKGRVSYGLL